MVVDIRSLMGCGVAAGLLAGCVERRPDGELVARYIGLVSVASYPKSNSVESRDIQVVGAWVEGGRSVGVGYLGRQTVTAPAGCAVVIIVRDAKELPSVQAIVAATQGDPKPCVISPSASPPSAPSPP